MPHNEEPNKEEPAGNNVAARLGRIAGSAARLEQLWGSEGAGATFDAVIALRDELHDLSRVIARHQIDRCADELGAGGPPRDILECIKELVSCVLGG